MKLSKHENHSSQNSKFFKFSPIPNKIIKFKHMKIKITIQSLDTDLSNSLSITKTNSQFYTVNPSMKYKFITSSRT